MEWTEVKLVMVYDMLEDETAAACCSSACAAIRQTPELLALSGRAPDEEPNL